MLMSELGSIRLSLNLRRLSALALFSGASTLALHAQQAAPQDASVDNPPAVQLVADAGKPSLDLSTTIAKLSYSSSSSDVDTPVDPVTAERLNLAEGSGLQPPPRRRYGRPRYNDSSHNPDGSNKYEFVVGVGGTAPLGNTYHYLNANYAFQVGGGRDFNKKFGVLAQFDYDRMGFNGATLFNQESLYNYFCTPLLQQQQQCSLLTSLDGNSHVWSFSIDPHYNFYQGETWGGYVVGGVGFFHKVANFTTPETGEGYSPYYGYYEYEAEVNVDHYTSNAPGFNGGFGLTYKPSRFAERLFAEVRYNIELDSQRTGLTVTNVNTTFGQNYAGYNYYPANSNRTTYADYKFGIRF
jgi:hypothetical protein